MTLIGVLDTDGYTYRSAISSMDQFVAEIEQLDGVEERAVTHHCC